MVFRERDDESDFCEEIFWGSIQETHDSCRSGTRLPDLVVHGIDDVASVWLDSFRENGPEELLL